ncbi:MAG: MarR family transcriptional regulator [Syntrophaceae bacterium]|nr:MarR family transcriptional regulator [Syntrophaceae bacterium]
MAHTLVELIEIITKLIGDAEMQFIRQYTAEGFTPRQIDYIDAINRMGHPTPGEIARVLHFSKPSVTAIVDKLVEKGYVEKCQSDEDRRSFHVHLTARGRRLTKLHDASHQKIADFFAHYLDEKDLQTLVALLNKVTAKV